ncbi:MAG TPA: hypothetical protein VKX17_22535 [Planctomycetota bacterium]|nr:hypothetical protein [Planctomycetota bacterium]
MELINVYPNSGSVRKVNSITHPEFLDKLIASMRAVGWRGRPLLFEEVLTGDHVTLFAWTGSHRIDAAAKAPLKTVPGWVMRASEAASAFQSAGFRIEDMRAWGSWRSLCGPGDGERYKALKRAGLHEAAQMIKEEIEATDGHTIACAALLEKLK